MWIEHEGEKVGGTHLKGTEVCLTTLEKERERFVSGGDKRLVPGSTGGGWTTHESGTWLITSDFYVLMKIIFWG